MAEVSKSTGNYPLMTEDESSLSMIDYNLHREKISFSEKAFAYKMKYDVLKKSGDKLLPAALAAGGAYALAQVMDVKISKGDIFNLAVPAPKNRWGQYSEPLKNAVSAVQKAAKK